MKFNKKKKLFLENEILSKASSAIIFKIIGSLLGYVFLLLVTRTAGPAAWGIFVLCLAVLNIASIVLILSLVVVGIIFSAAARERLKSLWGTSAKR